MDAWYYVAADGQRHGPLQAQELAGLARSGAITPQTLVWHEGMAQWTSAAACAAELGLPPVAPVAPPSAHSPPPRQGRGCLLAVILVVGGLFAVGTLGIVAAIALPAYQQYVLRSQVASALAEASVHKPAVVEFINTHGRCPTNDDEGFAPAESYAGGTLASIEFGEFEGSALCGLSATLHAPGKDALDGERLWLEYDGATRVWLCSSPVPDRHLPQQCRG